MLLVFSHFHGFWLAEGVIAASACLFHPCCSSRLLLDGIKDIQSNVPLCCELNILLSRVPFIEYIPFPYHHNFNFLDYPRFFFSQPFPIKEFLSLQSFPQLGFDAIATNATTTYDATDDFIFSRRCHLRLLVSEFAPTNN